MSDVTQYTVGTNTGNGPGDAYVDGIDSGAVSVLSDNDTVVTGRLRQSRALGDGHRRAGQRAALQPGVLHDPHQDRRVRAAINATAAGFCPNDITGLYTGGLTSAGALLATHPAKQYTNMLASPTTEVDRRDHQPGRLVHHGDNFDRGSCLGTLTVKGGLYQLHRGSLGVQWEAETPPPHGQSPATCSRDVRQHSRRRPTARSSPVAASPSTGTSSPSRRQSSGGRSCHSPGRSPRSPDSGWSSARS